MSRLVAEMMPTVTLPPRPKGLPIAITQSPTRIFDESPKVDGLERLLRLDLEQREIGLGVVAEDLDDLQLGAVGEVDDDLVGALDDVIVGDDRGRRGR